VNRLFVGIKLPAEIIHSLLDISYGIPDARWEGENKLHLTLRFIGEVEGLKKKEVQSVLTEIQMPPFDMQITGVGVFPPRGTPRILWAGMAKCPEVMELQNRVEKRLVSRTGLEPERRKYHPHITLARLRRVPQKYIAQYILQHSLLKLNPFRVDAFHLYSSILSPSGAKYAIEETYLLD
jgi:2'-5' RNA ligase